MQLKDYYTTLEVAPAATALQIKKSFRQLALRHHPDKNPGNAMAEARFKEIQEAYEILSDPEKREEYNYKRWYNRTIKKEFSKEPLNPVSILAECVRLHNYMLTVNTSRVDYDGLSYHIRQLLSDTNSNILVQAGDASINAKVIEKILLSAAALPVKYINPIAILLLRIAGDNELLIRQINNFTLRHKQQGAWQKYKAAFVVVITIVICWVIYRLGK